MKLTWRIRAHEWLADRCRWVQYPDLRHEAVRQQQWKPSLWYRYKTMTWREVGWFWFIVFWSVIALLAFTGPSA